MDAFTLRPMTWADGERVNASFNEAFGLTRPIEEWRWKVGPGARDACTILAVDAAGDVAAQYGALAVRVQVGHRALTAGQPVDVFCLRRAAALAPRLFIRTAHAFYRTYGGAPLAFIFGFPGDRSMRIGRLTLGYAPPRAVAYRTRRARRPARWRDAVKTLRGWRQPYRIVTACEPAALDALWAAAAPRYPVSAIRDGAWLARRYLTRPRHAYRLLVVSRDGRPHAWGVLLQERDTMHWVDLLWDGLDPRALQTLDRAAVRAAADAGCPTLDLWLDGDPAAAQILEACGWAAAPEPRALHLTAVAFDPTLEAAGVVRRFYLTMGDSDLF